MGIFRIGKKWYVDYYYEGRRIRKVVGSKKDAENALTAVKADILRGEYRFKRESKIKLEDFAREYIKYAKVNKKSWKSDQNSLNRLIPFFKGIPLSKITPRHIEEYKRGRIEEVKPASVNRELACLKVIFSLAMKWKIVNDNPVKEIKFFTEQKIEMRILDKEEIDRLIHCACGHLKSVITLAINTGMRKGEILNLKWNDIDFEKHFIIIKESKSGRSRKIPMNLSAINALRRIERESEYVFFNPKTKKCFRDIKTAFKSACRRAGIENLRFHDLRHTAATYMVTGGVDLVTVAEILGHADIKMTMRYAHPTPENKRKAVNVLNAIFDHQIKQMDEDQSQEEMAGAQRRAHL